MSRRFRKIHTGTEILEISANSGSILDRQRNTLVNTDMSVRKDGDVRVIDTIYNTSGIETSGFDTLVGDLSIRFWIKIRAVVADTGYILNNGKLRISLETDNKIYIQSDGATDSFIDYTLTNGIWYHVGIRRNADGSLEGFVDGDEKTVDTSGGATPVAGTTDLGILATITQTSAAAYSLANEISIATGLLTDNEFSQAFTSTKHLYSK